MARAKLTQRGHDHIAWCERMRRKLSRKAIAARLGVSVSAVTHAARGETLSIEALAAMRVRS